MRVFITGGSGWVGSGIIRELLATGHTVTALARSPEAAARLAAKGVSIRRGDLADLAGLRAAAADSDAVIHCAFNHEIAFSDILGIVLIRTTQSPWFARVSPVARADLHAIEALVDGLADSPNGARTFVCTSPIAMLPSGSVGAIAERLALGPPAPRKSKHFGSFAMFAGIDNPASSEITQQVTGWRPTHPPLLDEIRGSAYAAPP